LKKKKIKKISSRYKIKYLIRYTGTASDFSTFIKTVLIGLLHTLLLE